MCPSSERAPDQLLGSGSSEMLVAPSDGENEQCIWRWEQVWVTAELDENAFGAVGFGCGAAGSTTILFRGLHTYTGPVSRSVGRPDQGCVELVWVVKTRYSHVTLTLTVDPDTRT